MEKPETKDQGDPERVKREEVRPLFFSPETGDDPATLCRFQDSIIDNAHILITVLDRSGKILVWNRAAEEITGYPAGSVVGNNQVWKDLYPDPKYRKEITTRIQDILQKKSYFENLETTIRTRDGAFRTISWNTREVAYDDKSRAIAVGRDITDLKIAEERVRALNKFRESIIDNAHILIAVLDRTGKIYIWNRAAEEITGYPAGSVVGNNQVWKDLYPDPGYRHFVTGRIEEILQKKQHFENLETTIRTNSGENRIISWNTRELLLKGEMRAIAVGWDITGQKEAMEMKARLASIVESSDDAIISVAPDSTVVTWNLGASRIYGYSAQEAVGKPVSMLVPRSDAATFQSLMEAVRTEMHAERAELRHRTKSGGEVELSLSISPVMDESGAVKEVSLIARDLSEQRKAERSLTAFVTEAALRLKNPVEIIRDNLEDICELWRADKINPADVIDLLEIQVRNANQIVDNLRELNTAIVEGSDAIPESYKRFLSR
jgi:PAS domain S-box-containing protein